MTLATDTDAIINSALRYFDDPTGNWSTPGEMAASLDPTTVQTPALDLIDAALVDVAEGRCERLILNMPPQEGKSQRASRRFPLWMLHRNPNLRIAMVSFEHGIAARWGQRIREDIGQHVELGLVVDPTSRAKHNWELLGAGGSMYCVGINGSLTGRPVDVLIIDDPYKNAEQADSAAWQATVRDFWMEVALPRLAPGAPVVLIQTRWREDDMAGWLASEFGDEWRVINIPAQADHDPEQGETDPLGRKPGEFMLSARGRSESDWEKKKREVGSRSWSALYQGRPSPASGDILRRDWWREYVRPLHLEREDGSCIVTDYDDMLASWDLTFKDTKASDYVVGQIWMRRGADAYLLDQVRAKMNFPETLAAIADLADKWPQAVLKIVEDKANGPAAIASLSKSIPGIVPENPQGSKVARANAVAPLIEAGNVWLPSKKLEGCGWVRGLIEEAAAFPAGAHDDQVDALSQGLNRLVLQPLLAGSGDIYSEDDLDEDLAGFSISPV
jgi:predicted phage terminase large subunit-like protein